MSGDSVSSTGGHTATEIHLNTAAAYALLHCISISGRLCTLRLNCSVHPNSNRLENLCLISAVLTARITSAEICPECSSVCVQRTIGYLLMIWTTNLATLWRQNKTLDACFLLRPVTPTTVMTSVTFVIEMILHIAPSWCKDDSNHTSEDKKNVCGKVYASVFDPIGAVNHIFIQQQIWGHWHFFLKPAIYIPIDLKIMFDRAKRAGCASEIHFSFPNCIQTAEAECTFVVIFCPRSSQDVVPFGFAHLHSLWWLPVDKRRLSVFKHLPCWQNVLGHFVCRVI